MPEWLKIILGLSIVIVPALGFGYFYYIKIKMKKYVSEIQTKNTPVEPVALQPELLDMEQDAYWTIDELTFMLNTCKMNNLQTAIILGPNSGMEMLILANQLNMQTFLLEQDLDIEQYQKNLINVANFFGLQPHIINEAEYAAQTFDFVIIKADKNHEIETLFDQTYKSLAKNGVILLANPSNKHLKNFKEYFKLSNIRHEIIKTSQNQIVLITK
ncbi:BC85_0335 family putative methyltransferase [Candidatus Mycoplasma pogonae]